MKKIIARINVAFLFTSVLLFGQDRDNTLREIWRSTADFFGTGWITHTNLDLDHDGLKEFVLWDNQSQSFVIFEHTGQDNGFNLVAEVTEPISTPAEADIDDTSYWAKIFSAIPNPLDINGDGTMEFYGTSIKQSGQELALVIREVTGNPMLDPNQSVVLKEQIITSNFVPGHHGLSYLGDVDNDGKIEFFASTLVDRPNNGLRKILAPKALFEFYELDISNWPSPQLTLQNSFDSLGEIGVVWHGVICDIDGDGLKDVVTFSWQRNWMYIFQPNGPKTWNMIRKRWASSSIPSRWHNYPIVVDANKDGKTEFFMGTYFGELYYLELKNPIDSTFTESNLKLIADLIPEPHDMMTQGMVGDHDQDGLLDLYFHSRDDSWVIDVEYKGGDLGNPANYAVYHTDIKMPNGSSHLTEAYWDGNGGYDGTTGKHQDLDNDGKCEYFITATQTWVTPGQSGLIMYESVVDQNSSVENHSAAVSPDDFNLLQNYPNPFNASTIIRFHTWAPNGESSVQTRLNILDLRGRIVRTLLDQAMDAGMHSIRFDALGMTSGVYLAQLIVGDRPKAVKMVLLR